MKIIIFDYEVYKHDVLLGAVVIEQGSINIVQTWNKDEIKQFYEDNKSSIWVGHNNSGYDNHILESIVKGRDPYTTSKDIIEKGRRKYLNMHLYFYDLMNNHFVSLKKIECAFGKHISTTQVDFNIQRPLTDEEKRLTELYNLDDLDQTFDDFLALQGEFGLRLDIIDEFKLDMSVLNMTGTQVAETVLHARKVPGIENMKIAPIMYDTLQIKNKDVIDFYLSEGFRQGKKLKTTLCGVEHVLGSGGIHGARSKYHSDWAYYFDVSGYYNLIMINLDLLPRSIPKEFQEVYKNMYYHQLDLKKTNPAKRWPYKTILLSVFGAMTNPYCKFYDPEKGTLVTIVGQLFLVDLLEKLEGKVKLVQSNTDGVIAEPLNGTTEQELVAIINEWQERTGFTLKLEKITEIHQRDVNCYIHREPNGNIHVLGEAVKHYEYWRNPFENRSYKAAEPPIFAHCIVEYFMNNKMPEETIEENKRTLRMFQYMASKQGYEGVVLEKKCDHKIETIKLSAVNRAFAYNDNTCENTLYKIRSTGKTKKSKIPRVPTNCFVHNESILEDDAIDKILEKIDIDWYIRRAYERIQEFLPIPVIKSIKW